MTRLCFRFEETGQDIGALGARCAAHAVCSGGIAELLGGAVVSRSCRKPLFLKAMGRRGEGGCIACDAVGPSDIEQCVASGPPRRYGARCGAPEGEF